MWILEYQGKNLYLIRSAVNPQVMIGIRDHSLKQETAIILTPCEDFALWKIIGFIPRWFIFSLTAAFNVEYIYCYEIIKNYKTEPIHFYIRHYIELYQQNETNHVSAVRL